MHGGMRRKCDPSVHIRPGRLDDLGRLTETHLRAFKGHRAVKLGRRYVMSGHEWFLNRPDALCFVAECEGSVVGFVEGAPDDEARHLRRALLTDGIRAIFRNPRLLLDSSIRDSVKQRLRSLLSWDQRANGLPVALRHGSYVLLSIAVSDPFRGTGTAKKLMTAFEDAVVSRGYERLRLSVYRQNFRARRAYEKDGWQLFDANPAYGCYYTKDIRRYASNTDNCTNRSGIEKAKMRGK